jgi:ethanolamine utilization protein EutN
LRIDEKNQNKLAPTGRTFIAVDPVGAGEGEIVLVVQGSSARFTEETKKLPVDCAIIGIVDNVQVGAKSIYKAHE